MSRHPKPPEGLPLAPALSFLQHLWAFNHALERLSGDMLSRIGVTAQQRLILRCIATYPELRAGQLASLLHVDPGTISAALKRLEEKKLIERQREADDQRRVSLRLTKSGKMLLRSTKERWNTRWRGCSPKRMERTFALRCERFSTSPSKFTPNLRRISAFFERESRA